VTDREDPPGRLERRPEAQVFQVDDLMTDLRDGKLRLPKFQRPFRWVDEDRRRFFDSIYRGYPVGSLLLWKKSAPADTLHVAGLDLSVQKRADALYIVDGQQRIVSLAVSLLQPDSPSALRSLYLDTVERRLRLGSRRIEPPSSWMPVSAARDPVAVVNWMRLVALPAEGAQAAQEFAKRVQQARLPAYVIETDDENVVRRIFERLNTHGRTLTAPEVFDALHGSFNDQRPSTVRELAGALMDEGFGKLEEQDVLGAVFAIHSGQPLRKLDDALGATTPGEFAAQISTAEPALRHLVRFFQADAGIPHRKLLPYASVVPILALFFAKHPNPHPRSRELLCRWLYRGVVTGAHRGDRVATRRSFEAIGADEHGSVQRLLRSIPLGLPRVELIGKFDARYAVSRVELLALVDLGPRDLGTGELVDVALLCDETGEPATHVVNVRVSENPDGATLSNRIVHPHVSPSRVAKLLVELPSDVLKSHCIDEDALAALAKSPALFLQSRKRALRGVLEKFLARRAAFESVDDAPVEVLAEDSA